MDVKKKIDDFSATIASGLKDDPELMLDVKEEIKSHIEESCEHFRYDGKNDDESFDLALKNFGPSADIGSDIISANRKRMKLRAAVKLAFRAVIIPLSVILALYVSLSRINSSMRYPVCIGNEIFNFPSATIIKENPLTLWQSDPGNKTLFGNYIIKLSRIHNEIHRKEVKSKISDADKIDPDNALYNYLLADIILSQASEEKKMNKNAPDKTTPFLELKKNTPSSEYYQILTIKDIPKFESGLKEFLKGTRKKYYNPYTKEIIELRLKKAPQSKHIEDIIPRLGIIYGGTIMYPGNLNASSSSLLFYAEHLMDKGRKEEALELLDAWLRMLNQIPEHNWTLDENLCLLIIASNGERVAELYRKLGEAEKAEKVDSICGNLNKLRNKYWQPLNPKKRRIISAHEKQNNYIAQNHAGLLGWVRLKDIRNNEITLDEKGLSPLRELDYLLFERKMLDTTIYIFMGIMLLCSILTIYRLMRNTGGGDAPILLLPGLSDTIKVLTYGIIVPFAIYILYSRFTYLGRREYTIHVDAYKRILEFFTLVFGSAGLVMGLTQLYIFRKAAALSIIAPEMLKFQKLRVKAWIAILILLGICSILAKGMDYKYGISALGIIVLAFILNIIISYKCRFKKNETIRKGTVTRSMIPVFSMALLVLTLVCYPIIELRERYIVRENDADYPLVEKYEIKAAQLLNQEIKKIFEEAEKTGR